MILGGPVRCTLALSLLLTNFWTTAHSDEVPLWEVGVVAGGGRLPDYPAASESHLRGLALPFAIYRGPTFRVGDRGAARGIILDDGTVEFDLGLDASFPVDSNDNDAREGMDDLDFLLEVGPRMTYRVWPQGSTNELNLAIATRAVISTDFANWRYQGVSINPSLGYARNELFGLDMRAVATMSPLFGVGGLNRYFYRVADGETLPDRAAFDADDGYVGTEFSAGLSYSILDNVRIFGGVQFGYWDGAANSDSPLHEDTTTYAIGGGLRWSIFESERLVAK